MIFLGLDLNCVETICDPASNLLVGGTHEFGQVGVCANHAAFAIDHVSPLCGALWRRAQGQEFFLPGSLSLHGFCSTDLSRKFARHRSVPACASGQAVPHGHQEPGVAQYSGRCQREPRLAHLRRLCPVAHRHCPSSLCRRIVWRRSQRHGLRSGCQHHRPVSVGLSLGSVSLVLSGFYSRQDFDTPLRRVRFKDPTTGKRLVFLTNNFILPAFTITELYRCRWQVELFFKWIKQHLRIKVFFGTSENAVKTQIWIAVSVYVLVAIVKKRLNLSASLYEMLQILSLTMFERIPLDQLLTKIVTDDIHAFSPNQLNLFN